MVVYLYRWKLKSGLENQFRDAWSHVTKELRSKCGSLGSRLHRGDDGLYYGYAQWPNHETREKARLADPEVENARRLMREATEQTYPDIILQPVKDFLLPSKERRDGDGV